MRRCFTSLFTQLKQRVTIYHSPTVKYFTVNKFPLAQCKTVKMRLDTIPNSL